jgi:glycosyltransferase involved in cell wall biosynthesis
MAIIGRLHEPKGHVDLLAALATIPAERRRNLTCLVVGDGELRGLVEHEVQRLGLSEWVQLTGIRRDVPQLLAELDIFVMSSRWEGLPISLLEAMANGVACISTAVGGVPGVIKDGYNGLLVEARNTSAMASGLQQLLTDKDLRRRLGTQAKKDVLARYDVRATAAAYHAHYMAALGMPATNANANCISSGI